MSINFYPNRKKMSREIGLCIVLKRQEVLESFCSSCIFKIFEHVEVRECHSCEVRQGMNIIGQDDKKSMAPVDGGSRESVPHYSGSSVVDQKESLNDGVDFLGRLVTYSKAMLLSAVFLVAVLFGSASASLASTATGAALSGTPGSSNAVAKMKIVSVLRSRTTDRTILEKAEDKVSTMEERRLRILSSLCDRIAEDADTAGADIAFSLMTVLIVLS